MSQEFHVAVVVGSLRRDSINRRLAQVFAALAPDTLHLKEVEIGALPLYNADLDEAPPQTWSDFRTQVAAADAVLFVTPEYNRSVPGVLKNALDVGSRPHGHSVWNARPAAVVSASPGGIGGFGANHHLRQSLVFLNMPVMQQPEAYLGHADKLLGEDGKVANPEVAKFLGGIVKAFAAWIALTGQQR